MNQNLNVVLDLTLLSQAIREGYVTPKKWNDHNGIEHSSVTLLVTETKNQTDSRTHSVRIKADGSWKGATDSSGKVIYCGSANPSRYQPESSGCNAPAPHDNFEDMF